MINLSLLLSVLVPFTLADMNPSQVLEFINNLSRIKPDLLKPVVNLVLCDESDELIAGAIDLHYSTQPHLNIKQMLEKIIVNEAFAIFDTSAEWVVSRFMMEGEENKKFLVKNNSDIVEIKTLEVPGGIKLKGKTSVFNGLIGMLERGEIDVAGSGLFVTFDRTKVTDFGGSMLRLDTFCFMSRPGNEIDLMAFFKPLNPHSMSTPKGKKTQLWRQILSNKWARRRRKEKILITVPNQELNEPTHIERCVDLLSFSLRALGAVETFLIPETRFKKAWRICMLTYLVLGFFVVETYKAELTSYLTRQN